jgi:hypothetical protein
VLEAAEPARRFRREIDAAVVGKSRSVYASPVMRRSVLARRFLAVALLLHFSVLALNALPWSRFIAVLYPYYAWYPRWTGQNQVWAMYQYPDRRSNEFDLIARFGGDKEERPWGGVHEMRSRYFYFLEALFLRNDGEKFAQRFLEVLRQRWPAEPRPSAIVVRRTTLKINDYADVPNKGVFGERQEAEIARRW